MNLSCWMHKVTKVEFPACLSADILSRYKKRGMPKSGACYDFGSDYTPGKLPELPQGQSIPNLPAKSGIGLWLRCGLDQHRKACNVRVFIFLQRVASAFGSGVWFHQSQKAYDENGLSYL